MIVGYLQGGLGNNLFIIAASVGYAEMWGKEWKVQSDFLGKEHFNIPKEKYIDEYALPRYTENGFHYQNIPFVEHGLQLFGYYQSAKYFKHCQKLIRHLFECPYAEKIKWKYRDQLALNTVAVHVRRGDYLNLSEYHCNLETEYYTTAIRRVKLLMPDAYFVCFSDDIVWCKKNINTDFFIKDDTFTEFHLMSYCKHFIIANSSFSWWSSWLSSNPDKIVIAPPKSKHFGIKKKHLILDDYYCSNWLHE